MKYMKDNIPTLKVESPNDVKGYTLIDVRRPDEFTGELSHIDGATLHTLGPDLETYLKSAKKDQEILFICKSGGRSAQATMAALQMGFKNVHNLEGGMIYWNQLKFPVA